MTKGKIDLTIKADELTEQETKLPICGIIMPIANTDGYPDGHWSDVYEIICQAAKAANFTPNLVSFDDDIGVIQKRIVQNIYDNPIVVCDISSRNANVMFELGMRLAFDKPTIIIKDDKTPYSFDISPIEHLEYPSDLRYQSINSFHEKLKNKIVDTHHKANSDPEFTTFLKHFGTFKVAQLDEKEVSGTEMVMSEIKELRNLIITDIKNKSHIDRFPPAKVKINTLANDHEYIFIRPNKKATLDKICNELNNQGFEVLLASQGNTEKEVHLIFPNSLSTFERVKIQKIIDSNIY